MRWFVFSTIMVFLAPAVGQTQTRDETLADIRQELTILYVEVQKLKREMSTTGGVTGLVSGGSVIDRVGAIEGELQRLTAKTEELELRIDRIVTDGTNRIGDLEFRLVELEGGDLSQLSETTTLGGDVPLTSGSVGVQPLDNTEEVVLAVGEQADFDLAVTALDSGDYTQAESLFAKFINTYPGGPLSNRANLLRGEALEGAGDLTAAARVYLDTFSAAPAGPVAPVALYRLGAALGQLDKTQEACLTLGEVEVRFPSAEAVTDARSAMQNLGCQ